MRLLVFPLSRTCSRSSAPGSCATWSATTSSRTTRDKPDFSPMTSPNESRPSPSSPLPLSLAFRSLRDLGPARPAPAPRGFAAPVARGPRAAPQTPHHRLARVAWPQGRPSLVRRGRRILSAHAHSALLPVPAPRTTWAETTCSTTCCGHLSPPSTSPSPRKAWSPSNSRNHSGMARSPWKWIPCPWSPASRPRCILRDFTRSDTAGFSPRTPNGGPG